MLAVKAKVTADDHAPVVPLIIPDLDEVRELATKLHAEKKVWQGEAFGWQAEYKPERSEIPLDSQMTFTPADFSIGESGIWFFSMMWEQGQNAAPSEFLDDRGVMLPIAQIIPQFVHHQTP